MTDEGCCFGRPWGMEVPGARVLEDDLLATLGRQVALLLGRVIRHVGRG